MAHTRCIINGHTSGHSTTNGCVVPAATEVLSALVVACPGAVVSARIVTVVGCVLATRVVAGASVLEAVGVGFVVAFSVRIKVVNKRDVVGEDDEDAEVVVATDVGFLLLMLLNVEIFGVVSVV